MNNSITEAQVFALCGSKSQFPVDFEEAWRWIGYSRKGNAKRALLEYGFAEGLDFCISSESGTLLSPRSREVICLTSLCFEKWKLIGHKKRLKKQSEHLIEFDRLYVIGDKKNEVMKIGVSNNPQKRMTSIQTSYPWVLDLWKIIENECPYKLEAYLHKKLNRYRLKGEWFEAKAFKVIDWRSIEGWHPMPLARS